MKIVLLTADQPNQAALAHKLAREVELAAVVLSQNIPRKPPAQNLSRFRRRVEGRLVGARFVRAWFGMLERYRADFPGFPRREQVRVDNVNDPPTLETIARHAPDAVLVSGTNLLGKKLIESAGVPILNLHTGISPYVKGGPNCTNWCLAEGDFHLIGNTVMWIDAGIDTGDLAATERTPLSGHEGLAGLHWKVMQHAHDLYLRAVRVLRDGGTLPRVRQSTLGEGRTFYTNDWGAPAMLRAEWNLLARYSPRTLASDALQSRAAGLKLLALPK